MTDLPPVTFLNVDIDLRSTADLAPLAAHWGTRIFVLSTQTNVPDSHFLAFELSDEPRCPRDRRADVLCDAICALVEALPPPLRAVWDGCVLRDFNLGFESGVAGGRTGVAHVSTLTSATVRRISALNATITVTLYPVFDVPAAGLARLRGAGARNRRDKHRSHTRRRSRWRPYTQGGA